MIRQPKNLSRTISLLVTPRRSRRTPRIPADVRIRIALAAPVPVILTARASNFSTGGLGAIVPHPIRGNGFATIGFNSPGSSTLIWIRARLRHQHGFHCGFEFVETTAAERTALRLLCSKGE